MATLTLLHTEWPKLNGVLAILSAKGLRKSALHTILDPIICILPSKYVA